MPVQRVLCCTVGRYGEQQCTWCDVVLAQCGSALVPVFTKSTTGAFVRNESVAHEYDLCVHARMCVYIVRVLVVSKVEEVTKSMMSNGEVEGLGPSLYALRTSATSVDDEGLGMQVGCDVCYSGAL